MVDLSRFLSAWGAETVRVHLHMEEETDLDKGPLRTEILMATGGIASEAIRLVKAMSRADDPVLVAKEWKMEERIPENIVKGRLGQALGLIELADGGEYGAANGLMHDEVGCDLVTIVPDLIATGLVSRWNHRDGAISRSALGELIGKYVGGS